MGGPMKAHVGGQRPAALPCHTLSQHAGVSNPETSVHQHSSNSSTAEHNCGKVVSLRSACNAPMLVAGDSSESQGSARAGPLNRIACPPQVGGSPRLEILMRAVQTCAVADKVTLVSVDKHL
jgi:hypothetical protein